MTGHWDQIFGTEDISLFENAPTNLSEREAVPRGFESLDAPSLLNGLKRYAADRGLSEREVHDCAQLAVVHAASHGDHQRSRDAEPIEPLQSFLADAAQVRAAQLHQGVALERVELQIDFEMRHEGGKALGELLVLRDANAVGVYHQVADGPFLAHLEDAEKIGMQRGLAAGDLDYIGLFLVADDAVKHGFDLGQAAIFGAMLA